MTRLRRSVSVFINCPFDDAYLDLRNAMVFAIADCGFLPRCSLEAAHKRKNILILDREQFRYQVFMSDIAGHDIRAHHSSPRQLIAHVRNWLNARAMKRPLPGGDSIHRRFTKFSQDLPAICNTLALDTAELTYRDYHLCALAWIAQQTRALSERT